MPDKDQIYSGGCFCGAIRFTVAAPVLYCCFCHCRSCQRASGGAVVPWVIFNKRGFVEEKGQRQLRQSSPGVTRGHCRDCGTSLTYEDAKRDGQIDIALSVLDEPSLFHPVAHVWVEDKMASLDIADELPQFLKTASQAEKD